MKFSSQPKTLWASFKDLFTYSLATKALWDNFARFLGILRYLYPFELIKKFYVGLLDGIIQIVVHEFREPSSSQQQNPGKKIPVEAYGIGVSESTKEFLYKKISNAFSESISLYQRAHKKQEEKINEVRNDYTNDSCKGLLFSGLLHRFKVFQFQFTGEQAITNLGKNIGWVKKCLYFIDSAMIAACTLSGGTSALFHYAGQQIPKFLYYKCIKPPFTFLKDQYVSLCRNTFHINPPRFYLHETVRFIATKLLPPIAILLITAKIFLPYVYAPTTFTFLEGGINILATIAFNIMEGASYILISNASLPQTSFKERLKDIFNQTQHFFLTKNKSRFDKVNGMLDGYDGPHSYIYSRFINALKPTDDASHDMKTELDKYCSSCQSPLFFPYAKNISYPHDIFLYQSAENDYQQNNTSYLPSVTTFFQTSHKKPTIDGLICNELMVLITLNSDGQEYYNHIPAKLDAFVTAVLSTLHYAPIELGARGAYWVDRIFTSQEQKMGR